VSLLVAFDPAAHHVGWAAFREGRLASCGLERKDPLSAGLEELAGALRVAHRVVVEVPQVYQQRGWEGDPNDLIDVALTAGRIAQAFDGQAPAEFVRPHAWKSNVPKAVMLRRITESLDGAEQNVLHATKVPATLIHNVVDAIGLGIWALGRLSKRGTK